MSPILLCTYHPSIWPVFMLLFNYYTRTNGSSFYCTVSVRSSEKEFTVVRAFCSIEPPKWVYYVTFQFCRGIYVRLTYFTLSTEIGKYVTLLFLTKNVIKTFNELNQFKYIANKIIRRKFRKILLCQIWGWLRIWKGENYFTQRSSFIFTRPFF